MTQKRLIGNPATDVTFNDSNDIVRATWEKVKVKTHAETVYGALCNFS